ncbi:SPA (suppressor of phyA-105) family protein, putative [Medicago truncatula]|uniref:SPA (Suppressor of phyA-105) family protein, putative n=1 Tax=Medicago truncatula TaxID=3880 RepID=G7KMH3_MEDTR|nr:SPA (suppressor of phyA-105) family protein, putative [Medicago truncatula]
MSEKVNKEKNVGMFWPTITLVPSSKLVCVVKCWDSSNILQSPNLSSLTHEGNQENGEVFSQQVENSHVLWKNDYVSKSQEEKFLHINDECHGAVGSKL